MNITPSDSLRFNVDLVDNQPRVTIAPAPSAPQSPVKRKKRKKSDCITVERGSIAVKIYRIKNGRYRSHALVYYEGGLRRREVRADLEEAKALADTVLTRLENGQTLQESFGPQDQACYLRAVQLAAPTGKPLELLVSEYSDLWKQAAAVGSTPADALKFFLENRPKGSQAVSLTKLIEKFIADKTGEIGTKWFRTLEGHLERFAEHFSKHCVPGQEPAPLHQLSSADLNAFLRELNVGGRSRHNYRAAVDQLVRWAKGNGYLPKIWSEMEDVTDPGARSGEIKILTPEEVTKLLSCRQHMEEMGRAKKSLVPFIALQAFAGVRHEEINGEKALLDWRNIDIEQRNIYVPRDVAKTGRDRVVPISDNLAAWLLPYVKPNGKICELSNTSHALCDAKRAAGLAAGKNETRNALRKSYISYRLAVTHNIAQVAEEAGNSAQKIRSNYNRPIPQKEGIRWFNIWPTAADVVQLNFGFK